MFFLILIVIKKPRPLVVGLVNRAALMSCRILVCCIGAHVRTFSKYRYFLACSLRTYWTIFISQIFQMYSLGYPDTSTNIACCNWDLIQRNAHWWCACYGNQNGISRNISLHNNSLSFWIRAWDNHVCAVSPAAPNFCSSLCCQSCHPPFYMSEWVSGSAAAPSYFIIDCHFPPSAERTNERTNGSNGKARGRRLQRPSARPCLLRAEEARNS